jgi:hypothetical protein
MVIIASSSRGNWTCASTKSRKDGHFLPIYKIQYGKREPAQAKDKEMTNQNYYLVGGGPKSPDVCMIVVVVLSVGLGVIEGQLDLHQQQHMRDTVIKRWMPSCGKSPVSCSSGKYMLMRTTQEKPNLDPRGWIHHHPQAQAKR